MEIPEACASHRVWIKVYDQYFSPATSLDEPEDLWAQRKTQPLERQSGMGKNQEPCLFVCSLPCSLTDLLQDLWTRSSISGHLVSSLGVMWPFPILILVILLPSGAVNHRVLPNLEGNKTRVSFRFLEAHRFQVSRIEATYHHLIKVFLYHLTHNSFKAYLSTVEATTTKWL